MISVVVADDQSLVRGGIAMMLNAESDMRVVGQAADGQQAVAAVAHLEPDVVLMDLRMPGMDGIAATEQIVAERADPDHLTKVLILTTFNDDEVVYGALRAGASGFLLKYAAPSELVTAVRVVASGRSYLDPEVTGQVIEALNRAPDTQVYATSSDQVNRLTAREKEVLAYVAQGLSNNDISRQLFLSEATVKTHVARILMKTGSRDRAQAVSLAFRSGLVRPPS
jgi:DNA-binding NarL/FixJ family response regulator